MKRVWIALALIATLTTSVGVAAAPAFGSGGQGQARSPATHIIVFNEDVDVDSTVADLARAHGLGVTNVYRYALRGMAAMVPEGRLNALRNDPRVAYVEANLEAHTLGGHLPTGVDRIDADLNATANIDGLDNPVDVDVAIIDTGIDLDHPDLNVFRAVDCTKGPNCERGGDGNDGHFHGTHVAGTVGALDNGIGVVGMAPGARLWAVKVLRNDGSGFFSDVIEGIDYVTKNAGSIEVANMSLGGVGKMDSLRTAIQNSVAAGVVYVVAAGNSSKDVYGSDGLFGTNDDFIPASYPEVAAISAMGDTDGKAGGQGAYTSYATADDTFAGFTNFSNSVVDGNPVTSLGAAIDLAAPGVDILSTWNDGGTGTISGTSMAAPHVAGAAALEAATNGRATDAAGVAAIRQALIGAAEAQSAWGPTNTNDPDDNFEGLANVATGPAASPPALESISLTPSNATIEEDQTQQFIATGHFDDGSTADLTSTATWASSNTDAATVDAAGLATGIAAGTTGITTTQDGFTSDAASLEVTPATTTDTVSVVSITYATEGGKAKDKHLLITVALLDDLGNEVAGASVSIDLYLGVSLLASGTGTTGTDGTVTFSLKNAPAGDYYTTTVTDVTADGLTWDWITPENSFPK